MLTLGMLSSCTEKKKDPNARTDTYATGKITFGADESFMPIIDEEMEVFHHVYKDAHVTPKYMSESEGMNLLLKDKLLMMFTTRDFKQSEYENLKKRNRFPMTIHIGYDALAIIANKNNTDSCICVDDVKRILTGEALNWKDIYPASASRGEIVVAFDNKTSSTVHYVEDSILGGKPITTPNALGIIGSNWLNDKRDTTNLTFNRNIRVMLVAKHAPATWKNSYKPYQGYIYNDKYPFIRRLYALLNDERGRYGLPHGFAQFIISQRGQMILFKAGLLPAYGNIAIREVKID